ncbi:(2Fe-2S)-binding protein [Myxococcota bacterium]|nr:(2Fe-2S)-binding protein [Myxococcota bacterium]
MERPPPTASLHRVRLAVNGEEHLLEVPGTRTLLEVLREDLGLPGTRHGCDLGECGACTVLVGGEPTLSCLTLAATLDGASISTVEGLAGGPGLNRLQRAFAEAGASQCGYCTPGLLMGLESLLARVPSPSREQVREAISGNLCRCTGYAAVVRAVEDAVAAGGGAGGEG